MSNKIIFEKTYYGFEDVYDLSRDLDEMWDIKFNPLVDGIPGEFEGDVKVVITYKTPSPDTQNEESDK